MKWFLAVLTLLSIGMTSLQAEKTIFVDHAFYGADMDKVAYDSGKLALKLWLKSVDKHISGVSSRILFYTEFNSLKKDTQDEKIDALILSIHSYVTNFSFYKKYFDNGWVKIESDGKPFFSYVILKRKGTQIKNNSIAHYHQYSKISKIVVEKYAMEHNLNLDYSGTKKESKPVLDLFFKKCDVAVVNQFSWELMKELNPQLSQSLEVIHKTDRIFTPLFSLFAKKMNSQKNELYMKAIKNIRTTESGKQIMEMFKFNTIIKFDMSDLNGIEKFYKNYLIMKKEHEQ